MTPFIGRRVKGQDHQGILGGCYLQGGGGILWPLHYRLHSLLLLLTEPQAGFGIWAACGLVG